MGIGVEHGIPVVQVRVSGTFDAAALPDIRHVVDEVLTVNPRVLLLDLTDCAHIDAAGISLLLDVHRRMRRNQGRLTVHAPGREARRLLRIARVDHVLDVRADLSPTDVATGPIRPEGEAVPVQTLTTHGGPLL